MVYGCSGKIQVISLVNERYFKTVVSDCFKIGMYTILAKAAIDLNLHGKVVVFSPTVT